MVRAALALGAPPGLADQVAADAADRLRRSWRRLRSQGDPDTEALVLVVEAWDDVRRTPWWRQPAPEPAAGSPDLSLLDTLTPAHRAALVLDRLAAVGLPGDDRSTDPLGEPGWAALRAVPVLGTPPGRGGAPAARRARRGRAARRLGPRVAVLLLVVVLVAAVGWRVTRPGADDAEGVAAVALPAVPVRAGTDAWPTWWADGVLHLDDVALEVPDVTQVVRGPDGSAVYVDGSGRVVAVQPDGSRELTGWTDVPGSLVAADGGGVVAWADSRAGLVALTPGGRRTASGAPGAVPVAAIDDLVWVSAGQGTTVWRPGSGGAADRPGDPDRVVLDVAAGGGAAVVRGEDGGLEVARVGRDGEVSVQGGLALVGTSAVLSPDGTTVVSQGLDGLPRVVDVATGEAVVSGVGPDRLVVAAALGDDGRVAYVATLAGDRPGSGDFLRSSDTGAVSLVTCTLARPGGTLDAAACESVASVSGTAGAPLLAR